MDGAFCSCHCRRNSSPRKADVLARALKETRGRFASYWNALCNAPSMPNTLRC